MEAKSSRGYTSLHTNANTAAAFPSDADVADRLDRLELGAPSPCCGNRECMVAVNNTRADAAVPDAAATGTTIAAAAAAAADATERHDCQLNSCKLRCETNVLVLHRLRKLETMSTANFLLAILSLLYIGINIVTLVLNGLNKNDDDCGDPDTVFEPRCGSPISDYAFHNLEFWATFVYALVQAFSLYHSPKNLNTILQNTLALKIGLFVEVIAAFVPAVGTIERERERERVL